MTNDGEGYEIKIERMNLASSCGKPPYIQNLAWDGKISETPKSIAVGQIWVTPKGVKREVLKINPKSVTYREKWGGNDFINRSYSFETWISKNKATLVKDIA